MTDEPFGVGDLSNRMIDQFIRRMIALSPQELADLEKAYERNRPSIGLVNDLIHSSARVAKEAESLREYVDEAVSSVVGNGQFVHERADLIQALLRPYLVRPVLEKSNDQDRRFAWANLSALTVRFLASGNHPSRGFVVMDDDSIQEVPSHLAEEPVIRWPTYTLPEKRPGERTEYFRPDDLYYRYPAIGEDWSVFLRQRDPEALSDAVLDRIRLRVVRQPKDT